MPQLRAAAGAGSPLPTRIDTEQLRLQHPIADVVSRYGVELRRSGSHFTGRCPFHADGGRPNLAVFPRSGRWVCFRCDARGDAIAFVQLIDGLSFRDAAARLGGGPEQRPAGPRGPHHRARPVHVKRTALDPNERVALSAAVELYANRLMVDANALAYMSRRGFERELLERERVGYVVGGELVPYLQWRRVPVSGARRIGLLRADGRESLSGRIVFPEFRDGQPVWATGRSLADTDSPRYLGLPGAGRRPLLGWEAASGDLRGVCVVEGPMDLLALRKWGVPGLALCGTAARADMLSQLGGWQRLYTVLDADEAGQSATARLIDAFGKRVIPVALPADAKDPAELASRPNGDELFRSAVLEAVRRRER